MKDIDYERIIKVIKANEALLKIAYKNDNSLFNFSIKKCIKIIKSIEKFQIKLPNIKSKIIITGGNPYLTLIICLYCILNNKDMTINVQNRLVNTNKQICEVFYNIFKNQNRGLLKIEEKMSISKMIDICKNREITVIDSKEGYNKYKKYGFYPVYIPFFSIELLYNDTKYRELAESVFDYCETNMIEIAVLENVKIEEFKQKINSVFESNCVLLLQDDITKDEAKRIISGKKIYLNTNPFSNFEIDCIKSRKSEK